MSVVLGLLSIIVILYDNKIQVSAGCSYADDCFYSQSRRVIVDWDLLSVGDFILIKSYKGGYLMDDGDNTVSTAAKFTKQSMVWEVRYDFPQTEENVFQFKNVVSQNYLKIYNGGDTPECASRSITGSGDHGSWKKIKEIQVSPAFQFEYQPKYFIMQNVKEPTCCRVDAESDKLIKAISNCNTLQDSFVFEKLANDVQDPWGPVGSNIGTYYPNREFLVEWTYIDKGDLVLIKSRTGGYLKDDGDGTLSTDPIFKSQSQLWEIANDLGRWQKTFRNKVTKKYLTAPSGGYCKSESVDVITNKVKWKTLSGGSLFQMGNYWKFQPSYFYMQNVESSKCCQHDDSNLVDKTIKTVSGDTCYGQEGWWSFERVYAARHDPQYCNSKVFTHNYNYPEINLISELVIMSILILLLINISCFCYYIKNVYYSKYKSYSKVLSAQNDESSADEKSQFV